MNHNDDQPVDWQAMRADEIRIGIEHGLTPDAAARAADTVVAYRRDAAGGTYIVSRTVREAEILTDPDGFPIGVDPAEWITEPSPFSADDAGGVSGWVPTD
ncbi:hypothetical protein [Nakamurella sp.]|uniref:hypothetical protein n=1 Tax=Nakamurella sp. TaxID=1869182 RepID=UPI003783BA89